jgi:hypothetical protein
MQFSYDNASYLNPTFRNAASGDEAQLREVYLKLGGSRANGQPAGNIVIIPNGSWYTNFWGIPAGEVRIVASVGERREVKDD